MCLCYCRNRDIVATCKGAPRMKYKFQPRDVPGCFYCAGQNLLLWVEGGGGGRRLSFSSLRENRETILSLIIL